LEIIKTGDDSAHVNVVESVRIDPFLSFGVFPKEFTVWDPRDRLQRFGF
jgi:hypothetical protein